MTSTINERENYNCMMEIINVAVCEGLRKIFKQEWDKHYGLSKGMWDDSTLTGNEFYNMERTRAGAKTYIDLFKSGKRSDWDFSALSDAILHSKAVKGHLSPHVSNKINELRDLRNNLVHSLGPQHKISDVAFENAYKKITICFKVLKLSLEDVERIRNSSKEYRAIRLWKLIFMAVLIAGAAFSAVFYRKTKPFEAKPQFRVLPTQPIHLIAILQELQNLSISNNFALTYMYISGSPGSGKSQLARLVGQRYDEVIIPRRAFGSNTFVMTLNGKSDNDIYNSYVDFARRVDCNETNLASIMNSNQTDAATKIQSLKTKIAKKLTNFERKNAWLLIVDNVVKLSEISSLLPQLNDEDWLGGQILITTQDKSSVPPNSSLTAHISLSEGMNPAESCEFLTSLSRLVETQDSVSKVAKELDYQPLALASAAFYVKQLRESKVSPDFSWKDYLQKLDEGKRSLTETKLSEVNHAYSLTMSTVVLLAVKMFAENDPVIKHAFTFLSYVSHEPQSLVVVVSYVLRVDKEKDKEDIGLRIQQCSLVLPLDDQKVFSISTHRVVHDNIKQYIAPNIEEHTKSRIPLYVLQLLLRQKCKLGEVALIPHLRAFYAKTKNISSALVPYSSRSKQKMQEQIFDLTSVLIMHGEFLLSKNFLTLALKIATKGRGSNTLDLIHVSFPKIGEIYNSIGYTEKYIGNIEQARKYIKQALAIFLRQHGPSHETVARCYGNLGSFSCSSQQECSENLKYLEKSLKIINKPEVQGAYYMMLGNLHSNKRNWKEAKKYYIQADAIFDKILSDYSGRQSLRVVGMNLAAIRRSLGGIVSLLGDHKLGKVYLKHSIEMYLIASGRNNPNLGDSYNDLGHVHFQSNELQEAEVCFRRALEIYNQQLDSSHEKIALVSRRLAGLLEETGQFNEAVVLDEKYGTCRRL